MLVKKNKGTRQSRRSDAERRRLQAVVRRGACLEALPSLLWHTTPIRPAVIALPYATGAALPANAGMTSSVNKCSERSACAWGKLPQANARIT